MDREILARDFCRAGALYRKVPGLAGFSAFSVPAASSDAFYNPLEDVAYCGMGVYIRGLLGEIWRVGSFDGMAASYETLDGKPITQSALQGTQPQKKPDGTYSFENALPIRYKQDGGNPVFALRSTQLGRICCKDAAGRSYRLWANLPENSRGEALQHGAGDMIVCPAVQVDAGVPSEECQLFGTARYTPSLDGLRVVNGLVFERTYEPLS